MTFLQKVKNLVIIVTTCVLSLQARKPSILIPHVATSVWTGVDTHALNLYRTLQQNGHIVHFVTADDHMQKKLDCHNLTYYTFSPERSLREALSAKILDICVHNLIDIIICNETTSMGCVQMIEKRLAKIIYTQHLPLSERCPAAHTFRKIDAIIGVSPDITASLHSCSTIKKWGNIKKIVNIPPFLDLDQFLNFKPTQSRYDFFYKTLKLLKKIQM